MFSHILAAVLTFFLSTVAMSATKPTKSCVDCRHFMRTAKYAGTDDEAIFGKCSMFPLNTSNKNQVSLINDRKDDPTNINISLDIDYVHCSSARTFKDMCGKNAIYYKKRVFRKYGSSFIE